MILITINILHFVDYYSATYRIFIITYIMYHTGA